MDKMQITTVFRFISAALFTASLAVHAATVNYPVYKEGVKYLPKSIVSNRGKLYQCREGAASGWCGQASWAYAPGVGLYWQDAWKVYNTSAGDKGESSPSSKEPAEKTAHTNPPASNQQGPNSGNQQQQVRAYQQGTQYKAGDKVNNKGATFVCKPWPYTAWCSSPHSVYEPGVGSYWAQAWTLVSGTISKDPVPAPKPTTQPETQPEENPNGNNHANPPAVAPGPDHSGQNEPTSPPASLVNNNTPYVNTTGKVVGGYYPEWGIYGRKFNITDVPASNITHLLYAFLPICGPNDTLKQSNPSGYNALVQSCEGKQDFEVTIHDRYAALEKINAGDRWDDPIKGNLRQLQKLHDQYPNLSILPSIGGWTLSDPFFAMDDAQKRARFVQSAVEFIEKYDFFTGIDIDWEFPGGGGANPNLGGLKDKATFTALMKELRVALDRLGEKTGRIYELSAAVSLGDRQINSIDYEQVNSYVDHIFTFAYDFYGAWSFEQLGHHSSLYRSPLTPGNGFSAHGGISKLIEAGLDPEKIIMGVASYGRGWAGVSGYTGNNFFSGRARKAALGQWESGVQDYKVLARDYLGGTDGRGINGYQYFYDTDAEAPYLFNSVKGELFTFDDPRSVRAKSRYVLDYGLGGIFTWEFSGDNGDIVNAMHKGLGHPEAAGRGK